MLVKELKTSLISLVNNKVKLKLNPETNEPFNAVQFILFNIAPFTTKIASRCFTEAQS